MLDALEKYNIGWAKQIKELLEAWGLEQEWESIRKKPFLVWKTEVNAAAEKRNIGKLREECESTSRGETREKTKTKYVLKSLDSSTYQRKPDSFITRYQFILYTRTLVMGRYGMLKCASTSRLGMVQKHVTYVVN